MNLTVILFFCGIDVKHAFSGMPFDSEDTARPYAIDNGYRVYLAEFNIDSTTIQELDES